MQSCQDMTTSGILDSFYFLPVVAHFPWIIYSYFLIMIRVWTLRQEHSILRVSHLSILNKTRVTIFVYFCFRFEDI